MCNHTYFRVPLNLPNFEEVNLQIARKEAIKPSGYTVKNTEYRAKNSTPKKQIGPAPQGGLIAWTDDWAFLFKPSTFRCNEEASADS